MEKWIPGGCWSSTTVEIAALTWSHPDLYGEKPVSMTSLSYCTDSVPQCLSHDWGTAHPQFLTIYSNITECLAFLFHTPKVPGSNISHMNILLSKENVPWNTSQPMLYSLSFTMYIQSVIFHSILHNKIKLLDLGSMRPHTYTFRNHPLPLAIWKISEVIWIGK